MTDRTPTQVLPNGAIRYAVYDGQGNFLRYDYLLPADDPTDEGTDICKRTMLQDKTASDIGLDNEDPTVDEALAKLRHDTVVSAFTAAALGLGEFDNPTVDQALKAACVPVGTILWYAKSTPPEHFLKCDGSAVLTSNYPELYKVIGTTFGSTTNGFLLPDLRSRFIRGYGGSYASTIGGKQDASRTAGVGTTKGTSGWGEGITYQMFTNADTYSTLTATFPYQSTVSTSTDYSGYSYYMRPYNMTLLPIIRY